MEIAINFSKPPRKGRTTTLVRCHFDDKKDFDKAADLMGMTTAAFMRTVLVSAARTVIANKHLINGAKDGKAKDKG